MTAIATGSGSRGLYLMASGDTSVTTDVRNSILRGDDKDVFIEQTDPGQGDPGCIPTFPPTCIEYIPPRTAGTLVIGNSNFRTTEVGSGGTLTDAGGNSNANPMFANTEAADFHLSPGSPAINAGADFPENGSQDLDGAARKQGGAVDMGAYEFPIPVVEPDVTRPLVTGLGETNKVFAVGRAPTPVASRAKRHRKGTTFVFKSSEAGDRDSEDQPSPPGPAARQAVREADEEEPAGEACTRYIAVKPSLKRAVAAGPTAVPFSGRIGRKALKPGRYRVTVVVADAAGNRSKPKVDRLPGRQALARRPPRSADPADRDVDRVRGGVPEAVRDRHGDVVAARGQVVVDRLAGPEVAVLVARPAVSRVRDGRASLR